MPPSFTFGEASGTDPMFGMLRRCISLAEVFSVGKQLALDVVSLAVSDLAGIIKSVRRSVQD